MFIRDAIVALRFAIVALVLFGMGYHVLLLTAARALLPAEAEGSLIRRPDGAVIGARHIAQAFTTAPYLHPRPSAVDFNAGAAGGSNESASNPAHLQILIGRVAAVRAREAAPIADLPAELVTSSGSGLDPHISPAGALLQVPRIARARQVPDGAVRDLVTRAIEPPLLSIFGRARVNVLAVNLALDAEFGAPGSRHTARRTLNP